MAVCAGCGRAVEQSGYHVYVSGMPGFFHSFDCAETALRRALAQERLVATFGATQAAALMGGPPAAEPHGTNTG